MICTAWSGNGLLISIPRWSPATRVVTPDWIASFFAARVAQGARDVENYPAFMRYGFRSSLKADYCVHNLGFRCAKDL